MIPKECKRLAEVDFPIAEVSKHSARERSIRHGHPSTLHLWWARRPLAACRAILMALLLPDPCDEHCPVGFKAAARKALLDMMGRPSGWEDLLADDEGLRKALLNFVGDFANWNLSADRSYTETARALVRSAHPDGTPLVVDPFAGGGSIPLEALRLGCEAFATDLNPVACLILKVMLEDIPRHGAELAEELRCVADKIKKQAERELAVLYPKGPDGATPIAYLWARTVRCESPNCGAEIPLVRSMWLCKKDKRKRALRPQVLRPQGQPPRVVFEIFAPVADAEVGQGFASGGKAQCPACQSVLAGKRVQAQLTAERGGASPRFDAKGNRIGGARIIAVVTTSAESTGRSYRTPEEWDYRGCFGATRRSEGDQPTEEM
jgi:putative DNA methylase